MALVRGGSTPSQRGPALFVMILLLVPPFPQDMGILDWHRHTELMEQTYRWGLREAARLKGDGHPALRGLAEAEAALAAMVPVP